MENQRRIISIYFLRLANTLLKSVNKSIMPKCTLMVSTSVSAATVEDSGESQSESENSVSDSVDDNDDSVAEISRSFRSRQELCEQLNVNHMIQRIFLITLDNSK